MIVYPVIADADGGGGDETLDPGRALLSSSTTVRSPGTSWCPGAT